ncbi:efflux RND transporter periplasmic adaptor subunit [Parapedobacter sp. DT-150]|uniref:efflux RND transporter periplasmic adaptor subunit n=1 Tax=Parapedobacter sp. DT-150 TaxID=3396162 RepID=UPI003F1C2248
MNSTFPTRVTFFTSRNSLLILGFLMLITMQACRTSSGNEQAAATPQRLPVLTLSLQQATTYDEYPATLEGSKDIEIRPQVDGQLEHIYVDEGAYVQQGQPLFRINPRAYNEQLNNAKASLAAAEANLANARIDVAKLTPLVKNQVLSEVQLNTALGAERVAEANVMQAKAMVEGAQINLGYTVIAAPTAGYIGRIPFKTGSLVSTTTPEALTVLSEIRNVFVYFSLSENDFIGFKKRVQGSTIAEKITHLPPVDLVLPDGTTYAQKGKVELVSGQFDNRTGTITFRAVFPNEDGLLRSGNTGRVRIPQVSSSVMLIPQEATFEVQDKVFVFAVSDSNRVESRPIAVAGKSGTSYLVEKDMVPGDRIVYAGLDRLQDGAFITPEPVTLDSLMKQQAL